MRVRGLLLGVAATSLIAQDPLPYLDMGEGVDHGWAVSLGARLMEDSSYLGSDTRRTRLMPVFTAEYDHRYYLGSSRVGVGFGGGMHLLRDKGFTWDLGVGIGDSRPESRSPLLAGMGDRSANVFAGTGLHYRYEGFHVGFTVSHGMKNDAGDRGTLTLGQTIPLVPRWRLSFGVHGTWEDAKAMNYDFGVTPAQAVTRAALVAAGDPRITASEVGPFSAPAGMRDVGGMIGLSYRPRPKWVYTMGVNGGILQGDVRNSPLVGRNNYLGVGLGFAYRFGPSAQ
jgi:outer membrane scaffolding protein for murein synthesis (MipA/OmpV family)